MKFRSWRSLRCLNPFIYENYVIRVGGRLKQLSLEFDAVNPVLLSKTGIVTNMIVKWCHERASLCGRNIAFTELRNSGFWVTQENYQKTD